MLDVFSLPYPINKENKWGILLHQSRFPLYYMKRHVNSLQKGSKGDKYMVQNLTWSGAYLRITFSSDFIQQVLKLVSLTATGPEVYIATMITVLSGSYDSLVETINHMKSLKLRDHPGENVTYFCDTILVDAKSLESDIVFNPNHLGYIISTFEDTYDS